MNTFLYADLVSPKRIARQRTTGWWLGCGLFGLFFFSGPLLRLVDPVAAVVDIGVLSLLLLGLLCGLAVVVVSHWLLGLLWPVFRDFGRNHVESVFNSLPSWQKIVIYLGCYFLLVYALVCCVVAVF